MPDVSGPVGSVGSARNTPAVSSQVGGRGAAVLAGGQSRRMGRDKASLVWRGLPLAVRVAGTLARAGCEPVVQVGGPPDTGVPWVPDRFPGEGPLGGVLTAFDAVPSALVVVTACDLPRLTEVTVRRLITALEAAPEAGLAMAHSGRLEPLCAVWRTDVVAPVVQAAWERGERSLMAVLTDLPSVLVPVSPGEVLNANTPDDLERADIVGPMVEEITVEQLSEVMSGEITLIDVREPDEYASGHAPGAVLVPLGALLSGVATIEAAGTVYMICRSGARSRHACEFLEQQGITAVNVAGGTMAWIARGFDVVEGMEPT